MSEEREGAWKMQCPRIPSRLAHSVGPELSLVAACSDDEGGRGEGGRRLMRKCNGGEGCEGAEQEAERPLNSIERDCVAVRCQIEPHQV